MPYLILPSLLAANLMNLGDEISRVMQAGADMIHLDVMDNHYVPNLTFGPLFCQAIHKQFNDLAIDVHLMVHPVDELIQKFADAGATRISIHPEATTHLNRSLQLIKELGCETGLVLNPATLLESATWCTEQLDFILIMTVNPGFGGQKLITSIIKKIEQCAHRYPGIPICVDGGVTIENIRTLANAGATQFVAGSTIFNSNDYTKTIAQLRASEPPLAKDG